MSLKTFVGLNKKNHAIDIKYSKQKQVLSECSFYFNHNLMKLCYFLNKLIRLSFYFNHNLMKLCYFLNKLIRLKLIIDDLHLLISH